MENLCFLFFLGDFMLARLIITNPAIVREPGSLRVARPRTCSETTLASAKSASHDLSAVAFARHRTQRGLYTGTG